MSALIVTAVLGIILLYLGLTKNKSILAPVGIAGLLLILYLLIKDWGLGSTYFHDMIVIDNFSIAFNISMVIITILIFLFGIDYYQRMELHVAEQYALMIFALTGAFLMTSFSNLIMLFLVPQGQFQKHLHTLANIAKLLHRKDFRQALEEANSAEVMLQVIRSQGNK